MKNVTIVILISLLFSEISFSAPLEPYEKGQLAGSLGFGAMTTDAYYEICYSSVRTDNHLKGINKLLKKKWGFTYSDLATDQEKRTGRNYRQEAYALVNTVIKKGGECGTTGMNKWFKAFQAMHEDNLNKFHYSQ